MSADLNFADVRLNYDPSQPQQRFRNAGLEAAFLAPAAQLPMRSPGRQVQSLRPSLSLRLPSTQTIYRGLKAMTR